MDRPAQSTADKEEPSIVQPKATLETSFTPKCSGCGSWPAAVRIINFQQTLASTAGSPPCSYVPTSRLTTLSSSGYYAASTLRVNDQLKRTPQILITQYK
jgi:hypothetical protein